MYVKANNKLSTSSDAQFDSLFNRALKGGVDKGVFVQPKGQSPPPMLCMPLSLVPCRRPCSCSASVRLVQVHPVTDTLARSLWWNQARQEDCSPKEGERRPQEAGH